MRRLLREELGRIKKERKEVGGWKEEFKKMREEVKEEMRGGVKKQEEMLKIGLVEMRRELRKREKNGEWRERN